MDSDTLDTNYDMDKLKSDMLDTDTLLNTRSYTMDSDTLDTNLLDTDTWLIYWTHRTLTNY